jgi:hypothetical protein
MVLIFVLLTVHNVSHMKIKLLFSVCFFILIALPSCVDHNLEEPEIDECGANVVSFADDIGPIIDTSCAIPGCHNGDNGAERNWTIFGNFQSKRASVRDRVTRPVGVPGHMPLVGALTPDEIQLIVCWVDQGGENN